MLFERAVPPGSAVSPEQTYTGLSLEDRAPQGRPYVVCNFVTTVDGKATAQGKTALLGGEGDRAAFHLLRTQVEAVLAGTGTLRVERYGRMVRDERLTAIRVGEGRDAQPLAVVISRSGRVPYDIPLFGDESSRVALYLPADAPVPECAAQLTIHRVDAADGHLPEVLRSLRQEHGVRSLLCEGGPVLFNALLVAGCVDELFVTLAPALVGGGEIAITSGGDLEPLQDLALVWALEKDGNLFLRYRVKAADVGD